MIALCAVAVLIVGLAGTVFASYVSAHNSAVEYEETIVARYDNGKNVLSTYYQKVQEAAQVPGMMAEDLRSVTTDALSGRYGEDGSQAVMQWIQENYPGQIDSSLYKQVQQIIESGRNDFQAEQSILIDQKRAYTTALRSFWSGTMMRMAGFPEIAMEDYDIIVSEQAANVYDDGTEIAPIKLR